MAQPEQIMQFFEADRRRRPSATAPSPVDPIRTVTP